MNEEQRTAYELLLRKRTSTLKKSTTEDARHKYRTCKRLALDDALKQLQSNKVDLEKAMEGWSAARVKAFQAIDTKPNTYYYRFNAPGEEQRTGGWTDEEKRLFHKRLNEIGANGQWGIFSMAIPGRVGYQCSNYYRHLIETRQILDPNYVLDDKGKAHYLFTTKEVNKDGSAVKTFRTHKKKHTYGGGPSDDDNARSSVEPPESKRRTVRHRQTRVGGVVVGEGTTLTVAAEGAIAPIAVARPPSSSTTAGSVATGFSTTAASGAVSSKRKRRNYKAYESNDDEDEDEHAFADDSDDGDFTSGPKSTWNTTRRTRGRAEADPTPVSGSIQNTTIQNGSGAMKVDAAVNSGTGSGDSGLSFMSLMQQGLQGLNSSDLADLMDEDDDDEFHDPENPLPGFTDPITLDPVVKPAISPYGHVMGYDNWVRCLTTGDNRNTCPLTKKPLSKRDLVVLTHDNIEEYRDRIVNQ
ncbi:hypothetical protein IWQ60_001186 [Tieghemiomyces parasiticus]|uniref:Myb-like domain-containing protein n=1 Tax=Tieghemiomyces parasiticus TaxID=78921 RepID=A0A9W8ADH7_9FUNG|nr:hypothetical protein IWQ60_001186 [Tieghemiomyces parasiticus]